MKANAEDCNSSQKPQHVQHGSGEGLKLNKLTDSVDAVDAGPLNKDKRYALPIVL
jgi:hypothetical protein